MPTIAGSEKRYIRYYLDYLLEHGADLEELNIELPNIRRAVRLPLEKEYRGLLAEKLLNLIHFASVEESFGNYIEAQQIYRGIVNLFEQSKLKYDIQISTAYRNLTRLYLRQGDEANAKSILESWWVVAQARQNSKDQVDILFEKAHIYIGNNDIAKAESSCDQGLEIAQKIGYKILIIDLLLLKSRIEQRKGNPESALELLDNALKYSQETRDKNREQDVQQEIISLKLIGGKHIVPPGDIFISYSHQDQKFVERLVSDLRTRGFSVWWDEWEVAVGDSIIAKINEGIKHSTYLVVALSPHSVKSKWVHSELNAALMRQLSDWNITVLPLLLAEVDTEELPPLIRERKWADFRKNYDQGLRELLRALERERPEPVKVSRNRLADLKQKTLTILRDPVWQFVGALVAIIGLFFSFWTIFRPNTQGSTPPPLITPTELSPTGHITVTPEITRVNTVVVPSFELPDIYSVAEGDLPSYGKQHGVVRDLDGKLYVFYSTDNNKKLWVISSSNRGVSWSDSIYLGEADEGQEASAVVDSAGRIHLAWGAWKAGTLNYSLFDEGVWGEPVALVQGTFARDIAVDSANHPHIVISATDTYHVYQKAGEWVADVAAEGAWHPDVVVDRQDNVHIVFNDGNFYPTTWVRTYHQVYDGRSWSEKEELSKGSHWSGGASMTIDGDENLHLVWLSPKTEGGGDDVIYYARYIGNEWQEPLPIGEIGTSAGSTGKEAPAIASDENGIVYVIWRGINQTGKAVIFLRALLSDGWTPRIELGDQDASDVWWPSVAYQQGRGKGVDIVWSAVIGTKRYVRYTHVEFNQ